MCRRACKTWKWVEMLMVTGLSCSMAGALSSRAAVALTGSARLLEPACLRGAPQPAEMTHMLAGMRRR
jgi:hypothetical protein